MARRWVGRDQGDDAAWGEAYPHPAISCMMPLLALLVMALLVSFAYHLWRLSQPGEAVVPSVVGLSQEVAVRELRDAGLKAEVARETQPSEVIPAGSVLSVTPAVGRRVREGRVIRVVVSAGSAYTLIPDVTGKTRGEAAEMLRAARLYVASEEFVFHDTVPVDRVISIAPAPGAKVPQYSLVGLKISQGEEPEVDLNVTGTRSSVVTIELPRDIPGAATARIDVTDDDGRRTVFEEERQPGDTIVYTVEGRGEMTVEAYFGNRLIFTRKM